MYRSDGVFVQGRSVGLVLCINHHWTSQCWPSLSLRRTAIMSSEQPSVVSGAHGLLRGQRTKSYGSLVTSCVAPVRQKRVQHEVQPGETLQGLALTYGVSVSYSLEELFFNSVWLLNGLLLTWLLSNCSVFADGANQKSKQTVHQRFNIPEEGPLHPCPVRVPGIYY